MPNEYIDATIFRVDGAPWAVVDGEYPFVKLGDVAGVLMYYPVPPEAPAEKISVKMDDTLLSWDYSPPIYQTVLGDFPMIWWGISPVPENFTIKTHYEHPLPLIDGNYSFLYASGTGKYLGSPYAKETTAYINICISYDVASEANQISVYTIANVSGDWVWKPADYDITPEVEGWKISLTLVSEPFEPLEEDTLVTIQNNSVGGILVPVDQFSLLAPYIGLVSTILVATVATTIYVKRVKHRKEKTTFN
jgi:hypothetical protein